MSTPSQAELATAAALDAELRKRAARQAAGELHRPASPEMVRVRVLKLGADRVSMGVHIAGVGEAYYEQGEAFDLEAPIAEALEDKGYVEITGPAEGQGSDALRSLQAAAESALAAEEAAAAARADAARPKAKG
jgi:hypothetical protein